MNQVKRLAALKDLIEGKSPTLKEIIEDKTPTPEEWVAAGKSLMDYPVLPSGKRLGDCTRKDLIEAANLHRQAGELQMFRAEFLKKLG